MIQLFFKTRDQMGPEAHLLTKAQEGNLSSLIDALCLDDKGSRSSDLAICFRDDIEMTGARQMMEVHTRPVKFTELYVSFPIGSGQNGLLKFFRWKEKGHTRLGIGASDEKQFAIRHLHAGALLDAADALFDGILKPKPALRAGLA